MSRLRKSPFLILFAVVLYFGFQVSAAIVGTNTFFAGPRDENNNPVLDWQDYNGYHNNGDVIGIELGSTFSRVGVIQAGEGGQFTLIPNDKGENQTTSCVAFTDNGVLVGSEASEYGLKNPGNTICDFRRLLGRKFSDHSFVEEIKTLPYEIVESQKHGESVAMVKVTVNGTIQLISPEEVASHMMAYLKKSAGVFLGHNVWTAVTTNPGHPIYSGDAKYQALKDAGTIAGLEIKRVVNEPRAAAIAHGLEGLDGEHNILTYNIGANKTEVMLQNVDRGVWEVLSSVADPYVGGKTFETAFLDYINFEVIGRAGKRQIALNLIADAEAVLPLEDELSRVQTTLLAGTSAAVELRLSPFMMPSFGDFGFVYTVTQTELLESYRQVFSTTMKMVDRVFIEAEGGPLQRTQIDDIILIGSPDHIAMVQSFMEEHFGADKIRKNVPFDEAVVRGAAIQGIVFSGVEDTLCSLPTPSYVPLSIGIEALGGIFTTIIERNAIISYGPVYKSRTVSTVNDNQPKIEIKVFEGQRGMAVDNSFLGAFVIDGIPPAPKGVPQIEVLFQYNEDDLTVLAKLDGKSIDRENTLVIRVPYREDQTQVDEIISDADKHREEDLAAVKMAFETRSGKLEQELAFSCKQCDEEVFRLFLQHEGPEGSAYNHLSGRWEIGEQKFAGL